MRWDEYNQRPSISDRFSFSLQREIWARTIFDASYLMNFIGRDGYTKNLNMMDPRLRFKYGASLDTAVTNPFFNYGTVDTFPGALRTRATVSRADLLRPYPQYLDMIQEWTNGRAARYHTMELRAQRPFFNGISVLAGYAYVRGSRQEFYDIVDEYDGKWTWTDVQDPRHRLNVSVVWDVPVGREKAFGSSACPRFSTRSIGNWEIAGNYRYESGPIFTVQRNEQRRHDRAGRRTENDRRRRRGQVLVRYHRFRDNTGVHAAHEPVAVRQPQGTEL